MIGSIVLVFFMRIERVLSLVSSSSDASIPTCIFLLVVFLISSLTPKSVKLDYFEWAASLSEANGQRARTGFLENLRV
jgi:hypothetical protein